MNITFCVFKTLVMERYSYVVITEKEDLLCTRKFNKLLSHTEISKICPFKGGVAQTLVGAPLGYKSTLNRLILNRSVYYLLPFSSTF